MEFFLLHYHSLTVSARALESESNSRFDCLYRHRISISFSTKARGRKEERLGGIEMLEKSDKSSDGKAEQKLINIFPLSSGSSRFTRCVYDKFNVLRQRGAQEDGKINKINSSRMFG